KVTADQRQFPALLAGQREAQVHFCKTFLHGRGIVVSGKELVVLEIHEQLRVHFEAASEWPEILNSKVATPVACHTEVGTAEILRDQTCDGIDGAVRIRRLCKVTGRALRVAVVSPLRIEQGNSTAQHDVVV